MSTTLSVQSDQGNNPGSNFRNRFARLREICIVSLIYLCGFSAILFVFSIFGYIAYEGLPALWKDVSFGEFLTGEFWRPTSDTPKFGISSMILGTLSVTAVSIIIALPLGLGAAIYISEFATGKTKETLKIVIELLAAIPSVVWGFIGFMILNPIIVEVVFFFTGEQIVGINMINGGIILALMGVPIIVSVGEDALRAVPDSYREAAIALGAGRWEVIYRVLLPAAKNGLLAAVLLGIGRAIGETMAVLMCTGNSYTAPDGIFAPIATLTATIAQELGEAVNGGDHYRVLFMLGVVLFVITFVVNLLADIVVKGIRGTQNV